MDNITSIDLEIKRYYSSSVENRYKYKKTLITKINNPKLFLSVICYGAIGAYKESYEGAINLLAETNNYSLLKEVSAYSESVYNKLIKEFSINLANSYLEIFIKTIAYAYNIDINNRFYLIISMIPIFKSRIIKATFIDVLVLISDEMDSEIIKIEINKFINDEDKFISNYAKEMLKEI